MPQRHVREELSDRPRRINAGRGGDRRPSARVVELSVNHEGRWRGIPLRFTAGSPTVCLPGLDPAEAGQLATVDAKLRHAYQPLARLYVPA
ncbi:hypothetical protein JO379_001961 [Streptomyces syringium]|uniref:Uncharacterized protein n=1 Tax=Streptomyces syringium TaxID=76729 RepID=A0ABS4Y1X6_9ACTN|nr:hypothetical protein [Streptomyces syringium]